MRYSDDDVIDAPLPFDWRLCKMDQVDTKLLLITKPTNPMFGLNYRGGVGLRSHLDIAWDSLTHWGTLCTLKLLGNNTQDRAGAKRPLGL